MVNWFKVELAEQADRHLTYFPRRIQISRLCVLFRFHAMGSEWKNARNNKYA